MKTPDIETEWREFARQVLPAGCLPIQRREMRRAFMAGVGATLSIVRRLGGPHVSEMRGARILESLDRQIDQIVRQIGNDEDHAP